MMHISRGFCQCVRQFSGLNPRSNIFKVTRPSCIEYFSGIQGVPKRNAPFQIQMSVVIQTTYCIQSQRMQFHTIRSFTSSPMCIKLCVFTHLWFKSDTMISLRYNRLLELTCSFEFEKVRYFWTPCIFHSRFSPYSKMLGSLYPIEHT